MDAYNEFDRLRKLPKAPGYCAGTLHTEREAFDLAVRNVAALQPVAREGEAGDSVDRWLNSLEDGERQSVNVMGKWELAETVWAAARATFTPAIEPVAGLTDAEISYELVQDDMVVAGTSGLGAEREIRNYAAVYGQDGPVECFKVVRTPIDLTGNAGDQKGGA